jgi:hypothetical protein
MELVMKAPQLFMVIALIIAATHVVTGFGQTPHTSTQDLLSTPIDNLELEGANIHLLLEKVSDQKRIPIGLEVSPYDDLSQTKTIRLQIKHGTLTDALNSIVKQNPLYSWKIKDEVVNILPVEAKRDALLRDVLETKLEKFSIQRGMTRFTLRQTLSTIPAITTILTDHHVVPYMQSFMSRDFAPLGREYGLETSNVSVSTLLNQVIRDSHTKYWIVLRYGDRKQYFVLNL